MARRANAVQSNFAGTARAPLCGGRTLCAAHRSAEDRRRRRDPARPIQGSRPGGVGVPRLEDCADRDAAGLPARREPHPRPRPRGHARQPLRHRSGHPAAGPPTTGFRRHATTCAACSRPPTSPSPPRRPSPPPAQPRGKLPQRRKAKQGQPVIGSAPSLEQGSVRQSCRGHERRLKTACRRATFARPCQRSRENRLCPASSTSSAR